METKEKIKQALIDMAADNAYKIILDRAMREGMQREQTAAYRAKYIMTKSHIDKTDVVDLLTEIDSVLVFREMLGYMLKDGDSE